MKWVKIPGDVRVRGFAGNKSKFSKFQEVRENPGLNFSVFGLRLRNTGKPF